jgi:hypothetical protein
MIHQPIYAKLHELSEALHDCGWSVARCEKFSADTLTAMLAVDRGAERDRQCVEAARLLPCGVAIISERQGIHRVTGYRRAKRGVTLLRELDAAATL